MSDRLLFDGLHTIVVGADGDLGGALAYRLYQDGANLVLFGYDEELTRRISAKCGYAPWMLVDVKCRDKVIQAVDMALEILDGRLDVAITFAGVATQSVAGGRNNVFVPTMRVNAEGVQNFADATIPYLEQSKGTLVATSSMAEFFDLPFMGAYGASKAAVGKITRSIRMEMWGTGVKVVEICPNIIDTQMTTKGYTTRVGKLLHKVVPVISAEKATRTIYEGIVRRKRRVFIPRWMAIIPWVAPQVNLVIELGSRPVIRHLRRAALTDDASAELTTKQRD